jgi:hypothetical protein
VKIVTVLRTSDSYKKEYVDLIYNQCKTHAPNLEFVCISDDESVPGYQKMEHDWPTWWPKIEIFKIKGPVLYLDLDTIVVDSLDYMLNEAIKHEFVAIRDFYKDSAKLERSLGSGVMFWNGDFSYLYDIFKQDPVTHMQECSTNRWWGDQGFIEKHLKISPVFWQDIAPDKLVSWKVHCKNGIPNDAAIVAFHGKPKPWEVKV